MPVRTIDTRLGRPIAERGHRSNRPTHPKAPITSPDDERAGTSTDRPFDDWPFDFDPAVSEPAEGGDGR
jgi:hypothetical protein